VQSGRALGETMAVLTVCGSVVQINRTQIFRRISQNRIARYDEIFPYLLTGRFLNKPYPKAFEFDMAESSALRFKEKPTAI